VRRVWVAAALALGVGGTAAGAVYLSEAAPAVVAAADAGVEEEKGLSPSEIMRRRADRAAEMHAAVTSSPDAGVEPATDVPDPPPPTKPRLRPPRPDAGVVLPDVLDRYDVERALRNTRKGVSGCNDKYVGTAVLELTLDVLGTGEVQSIDLGSEYVGTPFSFCVLHAIRDEAAFPAFNAPYQEVAYRYGFDLSR
jgi:hypothetical protein